MTLAWYIAILIAGLGCGLLYLLPGPLTLAHRTIGGDRPWRRLGAGICIVLAVMCVVGDIVLDTDARPGIFVVYWSIVLLLVLWLCGVAFRDLLYTRKILADWRAGRVALDGTPLPADDDCGEEPT